MTTFSTNMEAKRQRVVDLLHAQTRVKDICEIVKCGKAPRCRVQEDGEGWQRFREVPWRWRTRPHYHGRVFGRPLVRDQGRPQEVHLQVCQESRRQQDDHLQGRGTAWPPFLHQKPLPAVEQGHQDLQEVPQIETSQVFEQEPVHGRGFSLIRRTALWTRPTMRGMTGTLHMLLRRTQTSTRPNTQPPP